MNATQVILQQEGMTFNKVNALGVGFAQVIFQQQGEYFSVPVSLLIKGERLNSFSIGNDKDVSLPYSFILDEQNAILNGFVNQKTVLVMLGAVGTGTGIKRPVLLVLDQVESVINNLSDRVGSQLGLRTAISHSNIGAQKRKIIAPIGSNKADSYKNDISEGILRNHKIVNNIDIYRYQGNQVINTVICEHGINAAHIIKNAIETSAKIVSQNIKIWLDSQEITNKVVTSNINLFGKGILSDFELNLKTDAVLSGKIVKMQIGNQTFEFLLEEISQDSKTKTVSFWGRSKVANLYEPWAIRQKYRFKNRMASDIASEICQPYPVSWQVADYLVRFYERECYALEVVKDLANAVGGVVRAMPDGQIYIVNPYQGGIPKFNLAWCLSLSREKRIKEADGIKVMYGSEEAAFLALEADRTEVQPGDWVEVKVYCLGEYMMNSTADVYYREAQGVIEEVEEDVVLENGQGNLSKPVLEVLSITGCPSADVAGQYIYCDEDCKLVTVRYKTRYDLWRLTNYAESKALFCAVETENSVTVLEGIGQNIVEIKEPLLNEAGLARMRAENELTAKKGLWLVKACLPFEEELCDVDGLIVDTPYGRGVVVESSIVISANPLKILNQVEVLLWPA